MIVGTPRRGETAQNLASDRVRTIPFDLGVAAHLSHVAAYLDGLGPNTGPALLRAVLYDADGKLAATSEEVRVDQGESGAWRTFRFASAAGLLLPAASYLLGLHVGGVTNTARIRVLSPGAPAASSSTDAYGDGPSDPLATRSPLATGMSLFASLFATYVVPDVDDAALARLPWELSQRVLGTHGGLRATRRTATCGWHGTEVDPEAGAFCIVRSDGPLAEMVGERVRVTYRAGTDERSVALFCHDEQSFTEEVAGEDLSLTRRAFLALAPLSCEDLPVTVEVLQ